MNIKILLSIFSFFMSVILLSNPDEDIEKHLTMVRINHEIYNGYVNKIHYIQKIAKIDDVIMQEILGHYRENEKLLNLGKVSTTKPGTGFCSKYLPAYLHNPKVENVIKDLETIYIAVVTKDSIPACKCYLKSFFNKGFKSMTIIESTNCALKQGQNIVFKNVEEINNFCQNDSFNPKNKSIVECGIQIKK